MSSKTKIVVLHLKELIYTGIFAVLGILFIVLLIIMFLPHNKKSEKPVSPRGTGTVTGNESETNGRNETQSIETSYIPGVYTTSLVLSDHTVDVEVIVDRDCVTSIRLVNLDEAVTTMYPLLEPAIESIAGQIYEKQSLDGITYADENKYTSLVLLQAIQAALEKASAAADIGE
ncbi:MAG: hypothetical protein HDR14_05420 [Lachnospiraceae bacterium]|nr:hypothetical protein [Lachnospiraceae bacterium]